MNDQMNDLNVKTIITLIDEVSIVLGEKWLKKKVNQEQIRNEGGSKNINNRKFSFLFRAKPHPLIEWAIEVERWRKACLESNRLVLNKAVLKYAILGKALASTKQLKGFDKLLPRLKQKKGFHSTAFEVEVASSYVAKKWDVEFIPEGIQKTPDLKIIKQDGSIFFAECKCRDQLTKRDQKNETFWIEFSSSLLRILGPKKKNCTILVKSLDDPVLSDIEPLITHITNYIETIDDIPSISYKSISKLDPSEKYQVVIQKLSDPDVEIESDGIGFNATESFDKVTIVSEMKTDGNKRYVRNPIILGFKNSIPSDKVTGIINGFKSAVRQLPKQGPGVIWIRIPDNAWRDNLENSFQLAESLLQNELSGIHNTRINAVILMTRIFQQLDKEGTNGLGYRPIKKIIEHENPRFSINS